MHLYINMDFLTKKEKDEYLSVMLKKAELETKVRFREIEKKIEEGVELTISLLSKSELKEYEKTLLDISVLQETAEKGYKEKPIEKNKVFLAADIWICKLFKDIGLCKSLNEAKKLIKQKGLYLNRKVIEDINQIVTNKDNIDGTILLQRGKKQFYKLSIK